MVSLEAERQLLTAARRGDLTAVDRLLAEGTRCDTTDEHEFTPLALAAMFGHARVVARLIEAGADPNHLDSNGLTILMVAAGFPRVEIIQALLDGLAEVNAVADDGRTALLDAVWSAETTADVVQALVAAGADTTVRDANYDLTPLEWAQQTGDQAKIAALSPPPTSTGQS